MRRRVTRGGKQFRDTHRHHTATVRESPAGDIAHPGPVHFRQHRAGRAGDRGIPEEIRRMAGRSPMSLAPLQADRHFSSPWRPWRWRREERSSFRSSPFPSFPWWPKCSAINRFSVRSIPKPSTRVRSISRQRSPIEPRPWWQPISSVNPVRYGKSSTLPANVTSGSWRTVPTPAE